MGGSVILPITDPKKILIGVIGDSISSRNNGATTNSWPALLDSLIKSLGVNNIEIRNYAIPGLGWKTAHVPTDGYLIGKSITPVAAAIADECNMLIVCLGTNDRQNPNAISEALDFKNSLPNIPIIYMCQRMYDPYGVNNCIVTEDEQAAMERTYTAIGATDDNGFHVNIGKLYDMGYTYDNLHPTDSGKQWIASACYMYMQITMPLTPISRNIAWLYSQNDIVREQMRKAST